MNLKGIQVSVEWSCQQPKRVKHNEKKNTLKRVQLEKTFH